ncbi:MAG TPA: hypothetical protein VF170_03315 [Planctomycetaceae bacterium]
MTTDGPAGAGRRWRGPLLLAAALTACWLAALLLLAVTTANPVTVNREQLLASDAVVVAVSDLSSARDGVVPLRVERVLAGGGVPESIRLREAGTDRLKDGSRFLVPLKRTNGGYVVTPVPPLRLERTSRGYAVARDPHPEPEEGAAFVYPATDDVLRVAERILATGTPRPYE